MKKTILLLLVVLFASVLSISKIEAEETNAEIIENWVSLGEKYLTGDGVEKNAKEAVRYFSLAAKEGNSWAEYRLGQCYENGFGVKKSSKDAYQYYYFAALKGEEKAQAKVGYYYFNGIAVEKNLTEAIKFFRLAADQGNASAQYNLGLCYLNGKGVKKDSKKAVEYFQISAEQGNKSAQYHLGECYKNGIGIEKNDLEAKKYLQLAADQGHEEAQKELDSYNKVASNTKPKTSIGKTEMKANNDYNCFTLFKQYGELLTKHPPTNAKKTITISDIKTQLQNDHVAFREGTSNFSPAIIIQLDNESLVLSFDTYWGLTMVDYSNKQFELTASYTSKLSYQYKDLKTGKFQKYSTIEELYTQAEIKTKSNNEKENVQSPATKTSTSQTKEVFTNLYGTPTTICAHFGCTNFIASSGDTNCCTLHSKRCLVCRCYIDEDATYCLKCLKSATESALNATNKKCEMCSNKATKILLVIQPNGESESFRMCQSHYDEYKKYFNSKIGWSAQ